MIKCMSTAVCHCHAHPAGKYDYESTDLITLTLFAIMPNGEILIPNRKEKKNHTNSIAHIMTQQLKEEQGRLYFAYGSNLSTMQMQLRCERSTPIGLAYVKGWTWIINERGYANIVKQGLANTDEQNSGVYGLVYRLHSLDEVKLDACEGVPWVYEQKMLEAEWTNSATGVSGEKIQVLVYVDLKHVSRSVPKHEYIGRMNVGIKEAMETWGLPAAYVDDVLRPFIPAPAN